MLSCIILTKNEEKNVKDCLESITWVDEIIIVDDYSEDKTLEIAKKYTSKIYQRKLASDFAKQRNFGLEKAKGDWILFLDADERISVGLAAEIQHTVNNIQNKKIGFYLRRCDVMWGKQLKYGEIGNVKLLRLAKKNSGKWQRSVHEVWNVQGSLGDLKNPLLHFPHQTLHEFISDIDFYSTLHAKANFKDGKCSSIFKIMFFPPIKFFQNWIFLAGFLDGTAGFLVSAMMSFHSFLSWSKLYLAVEKDK